MSIQVLYLAKLIRHNYCGHYETFFIVSADDFKDVDELAEGQLRSDDFEGRATEEFSDLEIGDSDDEILNKINPNDNEEDGLLQVKDTISVFKVKIFDLFTQTVFERKC